MRENDGPDIYGLEPDVESAVRLAVFTFQAFHGMADDEWRIKAYGPPTEHKFKMWVTPKGDTKPHERLISDSAKDAAAEIAAWLAELRPQNDV